MTQLFTTGYEGETISGFIQKILGNDINTVIDIRENPYSRKSGFSKFPLRNRLHEAGVKYLHFQELGTPRPLRKFLAEQRDYATFFNTYRSFLSEFRDSLDDIVELGEHKNICLLCFEKDPHFCHRKIVAELINEYTGRSISVIHI